MSTTQIVVIVKISCVVQDAINSYCEHQVADARMLSVCVAVVTLSVEPGHTGCWVKVGQW